MIFHRLGSKVLEDRGLHLRHFDIALKWRAFLGSAVAIPSLVGGLAAFSALDDKLAVVKVVNVGFCFLISSRLFAVTARTLFLWTKLVTQVKFFLFCANRPRL